MQPSRHPPTRVGPGQAGFSLVETLISVALVGTVVLGIAGGVLLLVRTSAATEQSQRIDHALNNFGESLKAAPYLACDDPAADPTAAGYQAAYDAWAARWRPPAGMTARVVDVAHWDRASASFGACGAQDQGAQQLTLEVTLHDRQGRAQIVKGSR